MFCVGKYSTLFIFWYYLTSPFIMNVSNADIKLDIINAVTVERIENSKFLNDVYIGGYKYRIFIYNRVVGTTSKNFITVLNKFYTMMNCKFAD